MDEQNNTASHPVAQRQSMPMQELAANVALVFAFCGPLVLVLIAVSALLRILLPSEWVDWATEVLGGLSMILMLLGPSFSIVFATGALLGSRGQENMGAARKKATAPLILVGASILLCATIGVLLTMQGGTMFD